MSPVSPKVARRQLPEFLARRHASNVRKPCAAPPKVSIPPLGTNAQPLTRSGVQLSDELWLQEYCAGIRDRQIAEKLRQDTTIRRIRKGSEEIIVARSHNKCDHESMEREWAAQAEARAAWERARSRTVGGVPVPIRTDEQGRMYVPDEVGERVYAPKLAMPAETTCSRFLDHRTATGRPVSLYSPIKAGTSIKRTFRGGIRRVYFTQSLETMPTDAYGLGYREGIQFERDRLESEKAERKVTRSAPKAATAPRVLSMDELVAAF